MKTKEQQHDLMIRWLGQRDLIADIFLWLRDDDTDEKEIVKTLANIYNTWYDGKNEPNPHVEHYLKNT